MNQQDNINNDGNCDDMEFAKIKFFLNPILPWMNDPEVTDITIYSKNKVSCQKRGSGVERLNVKWKTEKELEDAASCIAHSVGKSIVRSPIVDAHLPDKTRVCIITRPVYDGIAIVFRKFPEHQYSLNDIAQFGSIDPSGIKILEAIIRMQRNVIISGGTGSGKTTILNSLCGFIPGDAGIVTVEDAREIAISNDLWTPLVSKQSKGNGDEEITLRDLVKTSLRCNPIWVIVGEVRGKEAFDLIRAFTTGHAGAGTIHANDAKNALMALETLLFQAGFDQPLAVKSMISQAINIVIHAGKLPNHERKILEIIEVEGLDYGVSVSNPHYKIHTLYRYDFERYENNVAIGQFHVGEPPTWIDKLKVLPNYQIPDFWNKSKEQV